MTDHYLNAQRGRASTEPGVAGASPLTHGLVICFQLTLLALLYGQTHAFGFVYFDDGEYVVENAPVLAGLSADSVRWAFTTFYMSNWHPLTWLSHMLDVSLFGPDPGWAHLHNVALHFVNSLLVYALLLKFSGNWWKACLMSVIFLVHPLHVESVAWIAERKDLLSALFYFLGLLAYDAYRAKPQVLRYIAVLTCFVLALLAKPMAVTFPIILLILDFFYYRKYFERASGTTYFGRFDFYRALVEKLPFLALSLASCVVTILAQDAGNSVTSLASHSISGRIVTAAIAYATYLQQWLMPLDLVAYYPIDLSVSLMDGLLPLAILLALVAVAAVVGRRHPLVAAGVCWYLITLLPVIGLVQVGGQAHADRYMYIPSVGLLIACLYLLPARDKGNFQFANLLAILFVAYISVLCYWQIGYWTNRHVLFSRVLDVVGSNYRSHLHLAQDYLDRGMPKDAKPHGQAALELAPSASVPYQLLGSIALAEGQYASAEQLYRIALTKHHPPVELLLTNLGIAMAEQGNIAAGIEALQDALKINPRSVQASTSLRYYQSKIGDVKTP